MYHDRVKGLLHFFILINLESNIVSYRTIFFSFLQRKKNHVLTVLSNEIHIRQFFPDLGEHVDADAVFRSHLGAEEFTACWKDSVHI